MKLAELAGYHRKPFIILERHERFVREERPFTKEAIEFAAEQLAKADRDRRGSFSASSLGSCLRQQQFTFLGLPSLPQSGQRQGVLLNGDFAHLRLQMVGLSEGYLAAAEVPIPDNPWGLKGTIDGVDVDGVVVEYKSINERGFTFVKQDNAPKSDHVFQVGTYMLASGAERGVIFYENKNTQECKEFIVEMDEQLRTDITERRIILDGLTKGRKLAPMLEPCTEAKGWQFDYCDYKDRCPVIANWAQAVKAGS